MRLANYLNIDSKDEILLKKAFRLIKANTFAIRAMIMCSTLKARTNILQKYNIGDLKKLMVLRCAFSMSHNILNIEYFDFYCNFVYNRRDIFKISRFSIMSLFNSIDKSIMACKNDILNIRG